MEIESAPIEKVVPSFRNSTWSSRAFMVGIFLPLALMLVAHFTSMQGQIPVATISYGAAYLFMLVYPFLSRTQPGANRFYIPRFNKLITETLSAIPTLVFVFAIVATINLTLTSLFPNATPTGENFQGMEQGYNNAGVYFFLFAAVAIAPLVEEVYFRGFLFNALRARLPLGIAILVQAVAFGLAHPMGWIYVVVASALGVAFALIYLRRKTILAPILVHAGNNAIFSLAMLVAIQANANGVVLGFQADPDAAECVVTEIFPGSPAEQAGLLPGDIITAIDDEPTDNFEEIVEVLALYAPGDNIAITVIREGEERNLIATLVSRKDL